MAPKVEVVYGKKFRDRMSQIFDLEPFRLWGEYESIVLYLEWLPGDMIDDRRLARFVVPAYHPQVFLSPGATRYGMRQDITLRNAHELAGIEYTDGFYKNFNTAMINKSGIRPHYYNKSKEFAAIANEELNNNIAEMMNTGRLRPKSRVQTCPNEAELSRFITTRVSQKYQMNATKSAVIHVKCKACALTNKDYRPLWCVKTGQYVARRKVCTDWTCHGRLAVPQNSQLHFVAYCGRPASKDTSTSHSSAQEHTNDDEVVPRVKSDEPSQGLTCPMSLGKKPLLLPSNLATAPLRPSTPSSTSMSPSTACKGYNVREFHQYSEVGEKGPFKYWHGRMPVMNKMGRVRIWVLAGAQSALVKIRRT